ncbi:tricarboxylic transporter TctB (4TM)subunit [Nitrincola sp. A-D6]|uniref:tripartite tricarboxylate transporter TctB family protein n=1 Tax=Nitrincola sp. A-D6 TaxID=1545442 RepID=UPI00051FD83C|nr:tripartite tricarboxylate transporter TctB family protein [Nitrincola sp. A-D6]KGK43173.1 tricarboxylic transporter TctB (4TM)subunit [Nitrincola sp. A-D6]
MARLTANQLIGIILFVFSLGYIWMAFQIPVFPIPRPVDSDAFPKILGVGLLILSIVLFFDKQASTKVDFPDAAELLPEDAALSKRPAVQVMGAAAAVLAYALLIEPLGFLLSSALLGFGLAFWFGYRQHWINLLTTGGVVLALYLLMNKVMGIYLPQGVLPF